MLTIRKYASNDAKETYSLFYNTVHHINRKDYTKKQVDAWARKDGNLKTWNASLSHNISFVVIKENQIVGFADATFEGYIDRLYVHHNFQSQGIATLLLSMLEQELYPVRRFIVDASITAKDFFRSKGYTVIRENKIRRDDETLINYTMIKEV